MKTTNELLNDLAAKHPDDAGRPASDYRLAKLLGIGKSSVSNYRNGKTVLDDDVALRLAPLLGYKSERDRGMVLTWMHIERAQRAAKPDAARVLEAFARKAAACVLVAVGASGAPAPAPAVAAAHGGAPAPSTQSLSIMSTRPRPRRRPIGSAFAQAVANLIRGPLACL